MRIIVVILLFVFLGNLLLAQEDTLRHETYVDTIHTHQSKPIKKSLTPAQRHQVEEEKMQWLLRDPTRFENAMAEELSADVANRNREMLAYTFIKPLPANAPNLFLDSLVKIYTIEKGDLWAFIVKMKSGKNHYYQYGKTKQTRERWVLYVVLGIVLFFGLTKLFFFADIKMIFSAFYSNRSLNNLSKEENLYTSWLFVLLYVLFALCVGLFLFLVTAYLTNINLLMQGNAMTFLSFAGAISIVFLIKIVFTSFLGMVFDVHKLVRDYISALYVCYFNIALFLIPLLLILVLVPANVATIVSYAAIIIVALLLMTYFFRLLYKILITYQVSKFYLFLYLCILEISPIIILVKVIG